MERLRAILKGIDGRGYGAYKELGGQRFAFDVFTLNIDHVQGDPFASPSRVHVRVPQRMARFPVHLFESRSREIALRDWILRAWIGALSKMARRDGGMKPATLPGQEVLERSAVLVDEESVEVRFLVGLPAAGRRVLGRETEDILVRRLPEAVHASLLYENVDGDAVTRHVQAAEDADSLRDMLDKAGLVAFVADDSILPRKSGGGAGPLDGRDSVSFAGDATSGVHSAEPGSGDGDGGAEGGYADSRGRVSREIDAAESAGEGRVQPYPWGRPRAGSDGPYGGKDQGGGWAERGGRGYIAVHIGAAGRP